MLRCLSSLDLTVLGTGILVLASVVATLQAGQAIMSSGIACAFAALYYAELAGAVSDAGDALAGVDELANLDTLAAFTLVCASVTILRRTRADPKRSLRTLSVL